MQQTAHRQHIDFHLVHDHHQEIHARLLNWARWANGRPVRHTAPMFRMYQSAAKVRSDREAPIQINKLDAMAMQKGVSSLPLAHMWATNWCYLKPVNPGKACRELGTTMGGLAQLLHDARQMLVNRGF